jgi:hypothetical protein
MPRRGSAPLLARTEASPGRQPPRADGPLDPVAALSAAVAAEKDSLAALKAAREQYADALVRCRLSGLPWDQIARNAVTAAKGKVALTVAERRREAARLRKLRERVTRRHAFPRPAASAQRGADLSCGQGGAVMAEKLVRKITTITEETFTEQPASVEAEATAAPDDDDEDEAEPEAPRRGCSKPPKGGR